MLKSWNGTSWTSKLQKLNTGRQAPGGSSRDSTSTDGIIIAGGRNPSGPTALSCSNRNRGMEQVGQKLS
jgi:hypothetical protein